MGRIGAIDPTPGRDYLPGGGGLPVVGSVVRPAWGIDEPKATAVDRDTAARAATGRLLGWVTVQCRGELEGTHAEKAAAIIPLSEVAAELRAALDDRLIAFSPCIRNIKLPPPSGTEKTVMSVDEVRVMAGAVNPRYRALITMMAGHRIAAIRGSRDHRRSDQLPQTDHHSGPPAHHLRGQGARVRPPRRHRAATG